MAGREMKPGKVGLVATPSSQEPNTEGLPLVADGDGIFFVGNSFFDWDGRSLAAWVTALGRALTPPIRLEAGADILWGNTPLGDFLQHPKVQDALVSRKYKVFVLQGEEYEPVNNKPAFHAAVREFNKAIEFHGARAVLFMTWE